MNIKPKIAIFELTDCEGCEVQILSLDEKLTKLASSVDIINWRLVNANNQPGPYDICLIEGTVITEKEQEIIKYLRKNSKIIIALGSCACTGGIPSLIKEKNRQKFIEKIYDKNYRSLSKNAKPLDYYINVDHYLFGCPINPNELEDLFIKLLSEQKITSKNYPVCYECKLKENHCLILDGQPCLGPITRGGCEAKCPSNGVKCYGCWGSFDNANFSAMIKVLINQNRSKNEITQIIELFMEENPNLRKILKQKIKE